MTDPTVRSLTDTSGTNPLPSGVARAPFKKALGREMLMVGLSYPAQFQLAVETGFEAIEMESVADRDEAEEIREAAARAGLKIHSVLTYDNWRYPLSSGERGQVQKGVLAVQGALANARLWGADTLLLLPGMVDARTSYREAYVRSQAVIRSEVLPAAQELGVVLAIENIWNEFLLSPLDYVRYIDEFESPWVRAYLDVGNMIFGHPEHWVRAAGKRIIKLHMKDFRLEVARGRFSFGKIGEGDVDWAAVRAALLEVGFSGYVTSTGIPRNLLIRWMARAMRLFDRRFPDKIAGIDGLFRGLSAVRRRADVRFLSEVSRRFDRFRDGKLG